MIGLDFKAAKANFFDRKKVLDATGRAAVRVLSKFGSFVWKRSKSSIRKRKRTSAPGSPPSSHVGLLKRFIFFAYDASARSVVIGPVRLNGTVDPMALPALEEGGTSTIEERRKGRKVRRKVRITARPFMGPALEAELPGLPALWRDSIR